MLSRFGPDIVPDLVAVLDICPDDIREEIVQCLGDLGPSASPSLPALTTEQGGYHPAIRGGAIAALSRITDPTDAVQRIRVGLHDRTTEVCRQTVIALTRFGSAGLAILPDLLELMRYEADGSVIADLAALLAELIREAPEVADAVRASLDSTAVEFLYEWH